MACTSIRTHLRRKWTSKLCYLGGTGRACVCAFSSNTCKPLHRQRGKNMQTIPKRALIAFHGSLAQAPKDDLEQQLKHTQTTASGCKDMIESDRVSRNSLLMSPVIVSRLGKVCLQALRGDMNLAFAAARSGIAIACNSSTKYSTTSRHLCLLQYHATPESSCDSM